MEDILKNKTAVVYGAGSIGGAVAAAFALEEVGNMAAFMASDLAGATTGTTVSLNVGMVNH